MIYPVSLVGLSLPKEEPTVKLDPYFHDFSEDAISFVDCYNGVMSSIYNYPITTNNISDLLSVKSIKDENEQQLCIDYLNIGAENIEVQIAAIVRTILSWIKTVFDMLKKYIASMLSMIGRMSMSIKLLEMKLSGRKLDERMISSVKIDIPIYDDIQQLTSALDKYITYHVEILKAVSLLSKSKMIKTDMSYFSRMLKDTQATITEFYKNTEIAAGVIHAEIITEDNISFGSGWSNNWNERRITFNDSGWTSDRVIKLLQYVHTVLVLARQNASVFDTTQVKERFTKLIGAIATDTTIEGDVSIDIINSIRSILTMYSRTITSTNGTAIKLGSVGISIAETALSLVETPDE